MIDAMVATLKEEQMTTRRNTAAQLHLIDDKKAVERSLSDAETAIESAEQGIATLKEEIAALVTSMKDLDKAVTEATDQRKAEHEEFLELVASNTAAKELLNFAKNRLNKFYNPKLYKPPPKCELSSEDRIATGIYGTEPPTEAPGGIAGTGKTISG